PWPPPPTITTSYAAFGSVERQNRSCGDMARNGATGCYRPAVHERPRGAVSLGMVCLVLVSLACTAAITSDPPTSASISSVSEPSPTASNDGGDADAQLELARAHIKH